MGFCFSHTLMEKLFFLKLYMNRRMLSMLLLGFSSGLPLALTSGTLQAWYTVSGVDIVTIGFLATLGQPYVYKFIWAPLMDRYVPPLLGRRRGWMLAMQCCLVITIAAMAFFNPALSPWILAAIGLAAAFFSASQDTAIDAYSTDLLKPEERGVGAAMKVGGYRVAMIISGGVALLMAVAIGWRWTYLIMAMLMSVGILATLFGPEPRYEAKPPSSLGKAIVDPFKEFISRDGAIIILLLVILYKLGDAFALSMTTVFLIRGVDFSLVDVGTIIKIVGVGATILGVFLGGTIMSRIGLYRSLLFFGLLQAVSNLTLMWLAIVGKSYFLMVSSIFIEYLCGGMGTAAFVALLMGLCNHRYTATQYALLSALSAIGRVFMGPVAGVMVEHIGWVYFYFWSFIIALPGLLLLWCLRSQVTVAGQNNTNLAV